MSETSSNNKRIAKNTVMLYIRMLLIMAVTLYTSRVVLEVLGVEDFGIYNVVGGIVVLFTFINNAMVTATQRFLNYELGRKDYQATARIFSASVTIHFVIALLTFVLAETVGLWFLNRYIQYPEGREVAVHFTYQFSILTTCVNIIRTPYNAAIIAHERMSFYAYISVIEVVLRLLIVYLLIISAIDRLILYSVLMFTVVFLITVSYYIYCKRQFSVCTYSFFWDKSKYLQLVSFSGWSLFGGLANMGASQGLNILLNMFYGVTVNAAMGIANQVNTAVYSFVSNFQTAFNPQIVKSYAAKEKSYFIDLIFRTSKYSYFLLFVISLPIYLCCEEVLELWLKEVPDYTVSFCRLMIIFSLLDAIQGPLWVSVQATGKIRNYQILMSIMILSNLPLSYLFLKLGFQAEVVLIIRCLLNFVTLFVRLWYLEKLYKFPVRRYIQEVIGRCLIVTLLSISLSFIPIENVCSIFKVIIVVFISLLFNISLIYSMGLESLERELIKTQIQKFYEQYKRY